MKSANWLNIWVFFVIHVVVMVDHTLGDCVLFLISKHTERNTKSDIYTTLLSAGPTWCRDKVCRNKQAALVRSFAFHGRLNFVSRAHRNAHFASARADSSVANNRIRGPLQVSDKPFAGAEHEGRQRCTSEKLEKGTGSEAWSLYVE